MTTSALEDEVLHLPEQERARLAHKLLLSLDTQDENEVAESWRKEAKCRAEDLDKGLAAPIAAEVVSAAARALLK